MSRHTTWGVASVLAAALLWGTTGTAAALAPGVGPLAIGAAAMGLGGLLQAAVAARAMLRHRGELTASWRTLVLSAAAVAVYPLAFYSAMRLAGVAVGTVVSIGSAPAAAAIIERITDHRPLSRRWAVGAAAGVSGVLALALARPSQPGAPAAAGAPGLHGLPVGAAPHVALGIALGVLAGLTYALYSWGAARVMRRGLPSRPVMGAIFGAGGLLLLPVLALTGGPILESSRHVAVAAYLAIVPMFLGYVLFGRGLAAVAASTATTLSLLEPAVAAVIAVIVLHEHLPAAGWLGMGLLFASLAVTTSSPGPAGGTGLQAAPPHGRRSYCGRHGSRSASCELHLVRRTPPVRRRPRQDGQAG